VLMDDPSHWNLVQASTIAIMVVLLRLKNFDRPFEKLGPKNVEIEDSHTQSVLLVSRTLHTEEFSCAPSNLIFQFFHSLASPDTGSLVPRKTVHHSLPQLAGGNARPLKPQPLDLLKDH